MQFRLPRGMLGVGTSLQHDGVPLRQVLQLVVDAPAIVVVASTVAVLVTAALIVSAGAGLLVTARRRRRVHLRGPRPVSYRPQPLQRWDLQT